jgi:hypothetical protein
MVFGKFHAGLKYQRGANLHRLLKNTLYRHPERSEGSQASGKARFFAALRMTFSAIFDFFNSLYIVEL